MREISDIEELIRRWELLGHLEDHLIIEVDEANEPAALALARRLGKAYWNRMRPDRDLEEAYLELEYPGEENGNLSSKFFSSRTLWRETGSLKESWPSSLEGACLPTIKGRTSCWSISWKDSHLSALF